MDDKDEDLLFLAFMAKILGLSWLYAYCLTVFITFLCVIEPPLPDDCLVFFMEYRTPLWNGGDV